MQDSLLGALRDRRPHVRDRWEALLRVEPVGSPLGHPDALVHLIDWTLDEIFGGLAGFPARLRAGRTRDGEPPPCPCGRNPLLAFFAAGAQAMREALVLTQAAADALDPAERDTTFEELNVVLRHITHRDIAAFCAICQQRAAAASAFAQEPAETRLQPGHVGHVQ